MIFYNLNNNLSKVKDKEEEGRTHSRILNTWGTVTDSAVPGCKCQMPASPSSPIGKHVWGILGTPSSLS